LSVVGVGLAAVRAELERCSRCGKCRSVCPVFDVSLNEAMVTRGRIELLRAFLEGRLPVTRQLIRYLNSCLKCLRCASICPSGVDFKRVAEAVRDRVSREVGLPLLARIGIQVLTPHRWLFDLTVGLAGLFQRLVPPGPGLPIRHLPMMLYGLRRLPRLASRSVLQRYRQPVGPEDAPMTVAFFVGCLQNYVFTDAADAAIELLVRAGFRVVVPSGQICCGTPALSVGARRVARRLARTNVAQFEAAGADAVVVTCATGGSALKNEYPDLLGRLGRRWAERTYDLSEFLARFADPQALPFQAGDSASPRRRHSGFGASATVSYHDPCHLRWVQGVYEEPRELLRRSGPYEELLGAELCCGLGGVFALFYPELSESIARKKLPGLEALRGGAGGEAVTVATECPGCRLQLEALVGKEELPVRIRMLAEVLRDRLTAAEPTAAGDSSPSA